jgi:hypothetical protein
MNIYMWKLVVRYMLISLKVMVGTNISLTDIFKEQNKEVFVLVEDLEKLVKTL